MNSKLKKVAIIMGSNSDWPVMKHAADTLDFFGVASRSIAQRGGRVYKTLVNKMFKHST